MNTVRRAAAAGPGAGGSGRKRATIAITGPKIPIPQTQPIALVNQGGHWLLLHDSETQVMQLLNHDGRRLHHHPYVGVGPLLPPFSFSPGR